MGSRFDAPFVIARAACVGALFALGCSSNDSPGQSVGSAGSAASAAGTAGTTQTEGTAGSAGAGGTAAAGAGGAGGSGGSAGSGGSGGMNAGGSGGTVTAAGAGGVGGSGGTGGSGGSSITDPGTEGDGDYQIMPPFQEAPEMSDQQGVPKGQVIQFNMDNSTTFNDGSRKVGVYVPDGYVSGTAVPFMVVQDGITDQNGGSFGLDDMRPLLDNMIAAGRLPHMAAVFVDPSMQQGQRSIEYDTVSDTYYQFVETELLPAAIQEVQTQAGLTLNLTSDPEGRGAFGGSSGGAAAFTMGWFHPESYRRILTISGSFVKLKSSTEYPDGAADYQMQLIPNSPVQPLRIFLQAGTMDLGGTRWEDANVAMAAALAAKGYHYRFIHADTATHEDNAARRQYLPDAMEWLWRGYPIE